MKCTKYDCLTYDKRYLWAYLLQPCCTNHPLSLYQKKEEMIMGTCSCGTCSCASQKEKNVETSVFKSYWKVALSFILLMSGILLNLLDAPFFGEDCVALVWYIIAYLPVGIPIMKEAWEGIKQKDYFSEFTLMIIATLGAFYIGEH